MEVVVDWNAVCLVCLQGGEMRSIFEQDDQNVAISEKIMRCSDVTIQKGMNLPEQICNSCFEDLSIAYKFRTNCESSNVILKSFLSVNSNIDISGSPSSGKEKLKYNIVQPSDKLNIKKIIKVSPRFHIEEPITSAISDEDNFICNDDILDDFSDDGCFKLEQEVKEDEQQPLKIENDIETEQEHEKKEDLNESADKSIEEILEDLGEELEQQIAKNKTQIKSPEKKPKKVFQISSHKYKTRKRGRPKTTVGKQKVDGIEITPENVSSMVPRLTTVAYVKPKKNDDKPLKMCEICGNGYKYQHALDSHMRRHKNEKPYSCEFCERAFVSNVELRRHMRVHTGQKPYACRFCDRRFSDFGSRIKHERTHTGERPYECAACGKTFAYAHVLSVHVLTHTGEKRFKCEICDRGFTKKIYLKGHMDRHAEDAEIMQQDIQVLPNNSASTATKDENWI